MNKRRAGFTLLEVVVTIGIFTFIVVTVLAFTTRSFQSFFGLNAETSAISQARQALDRLSRELREAQTNIVGAYPIVSAGPNEIIFYADVDSDPDIERVRYSYSGTILNRGVIQPVGAPPSYPTNQERLTLIADHMYNTIPVFTYYQGSFTGDQPPMSDPITLTDVRLVAFSVRIDEDTTKKPEPIILESSAALRNLKDNL